MVIPALAMGKLCFAVMISLLSRSAVAKQADRLNCRLGSGLVTTPALIDGPAVAGLMVAGPVEADPVDVVPEDEDPEDEGPEDEGPAAEGPEDEDPEDEDASAAEVSRSSGPWATAAGKTQSNSTTAVSVPQPNDTVLALRSIIE
jgi:hypothetical protein